MTERILVLSSQAFSLWQFRLDMMKNFISKGYEVIAAAPDLVNDWKDRFQEMGIVYCSFSMERNGENPVKDIFSYFALKKLMREIRPKYVFTYQAKTVIYGTLAAYHCGIREIYALIAGLGSVFRNKRMTLLMRVVKKILSVEYRMALHRAKVVLFQNHDDSKVFVEKRLVDKSKIRYMNGSGVNLKHFVKSDLPKVKKILFVGRIIRDKGILEYLEAARIVRVKHPEAVFEVIGYYDTNPTALKAEDVQPYIDDGTIHYLGKKDDVYPWLKGCYAFVLPSYHEGTPKSILEAMAVGRPIITTDAPGCRETVKDGYNGFLVPICETKLLADRMCQLIEDESLAKEMGEKSHEIAKEKYDVNKVNQFIVDIMNL